MMAVCTPSWVIMHMCGAPPVALGTYTAMSGVHEYLVRVCGSIPEVHTCYSTFEAIELRRRSVISCTVQHASSVPALQHTRLAILRISYTYAHARTHTQHTPSSRMRMCHYTHLRERAKVPHHSPRKVTPYTVAIGNDCHEQRGKALELRVSWVRMVGRFPRARDACNGQTGGQVGSSKLI